MDIFGAVDLLSNLSAPPCAVIRIVDQVDHGEAPILIPKRGDPGVREGVADDHRGAVSYTHLDVYKRQVVLTPFSHGITARMEHEDLSIFEYVFCWLRCV